MINSVITQTENFAGFSLPSNYRKYVSQLDENNFDYFYPLTYVIERNTTYEIQSIVPDILLIGQDGDLGFYLQANQGDVIFELDLGALGSLELRDFSDTIQNAITKIETDLLEDD